MPRKYAGPLQPGARSAKVPKAMTTRAPPKKYRKKYDLSKPMKTLIEKEINKNEETQERQYQSRLMELPNIPDQNFHLFRAFPLVYQAGQTINNVVLPSNRENRTGTQIRAMNLKLQGRIFIPVDSDTIDNDRACLSCRLLVLSCKKYKKWEDIFNNWDTGSELQADLLKNGSESVAFDGYQFGLNLPVNDELFTTHHDSKFLLNRGVIQTRTYGNVPVTEGYGAAHMPFAVHYFKKYIKCKNKIIKYDEETNPAPTNFAPFAILLYSYTNGAAPSNVEVIKMQTQATLRWKNM